MMKRILITALVVSGLLLGGCKKDTAENETPDNTTETSADNPTEGSIKIADNPNNTVKYDDKTIPLKSFDIEKVTGYAYGQVTIFSKDLDGALNKYHIGINFLGGLPKTGETRNALYDNTTIGFNTYNNGDLYAYVAINGSLKIESNDGHNVTLLASDMDMKQISTNSYDISAKRFRVKAFRVKFSY